jgi:hypothetical protein
VKHRPRLLVGSALTLGPMTAACLSPSPSATAGTGATTTLRDGGTVIVSIATDAGAPSPLTAFAQNYWDWVDWADSGVTGMTGTQDPVKALQVALLRAGGNNNDSSSPAPFDSRQIDAFVRYCGAVGAEPIIQVPLLSNNVDGGASTAQSAADMVTYANVTMGYGVKYWEIGNEPDLYAQSHPEAQIATAADYCARFSSYAAAMRAVGGGTAIQILGPEISQPNATWLTAFLDRCKADVDVVTVHRYPFGPQTTMTGALSDATQFQSAIAQMQTVVQQHARPSTPFGITESNLSWQYDPKTYSAEALNAAPGTYPAALWTADAMGTALANKLWTFALWNIGETDRNGSVLGFLTGGQPTPAYYAEQMVSANLRGSVVTPAGVPSGFSVYASHDPAPGVTSVLVINKTAAAAPLALAVDGDNKATLDLPAQSITLVRVPDAAGATAQVIRYTAEIADAGAPPQLVP